MSTLCEPSGSKPTCRDEYSNQTFYLYNCCILHESAHNEPVVLLKGSAWDQQQPPSGLGTSCKENSRPSQIWQMSCL